MPAKGRSRKKKYQEAKPYVTCNSPVYLSSVLYKCCMLDFLCKKKIFSFLIFFLFKGLKTSFRYLGKCKETKKRKQKKKEKKTSTV